MSTICVSLSAEIIQKISEDIKGTSFETVEAFIESLVKQRYPELNESVYTEEEEEKIKDRLRKLGYL